VFHLALLRPGRVVRLHRRQPGLSARRAYRGHSLRLDPRHRVVHWLFANGDARSGFVYSDRDTKLTGSCDRTISTGRVAADFLQKFNLTLHRGWNSVVAYFSVPQPGHIVADLKAGSNGAHEKWYFFRPPPAS
jgi:hypothetical protein